MSSSTVFNIPKPPALLETIPMQSVSSPGHTNYNFHSPGEVVIPIPGRVVLRFMRVIAGDFPMTLGRERWRGLTPADGPFPTVTWTGNRPQGLAFSEPEEPNTISWIRNTAGSGVLVVDYTVCEQEVQTVCQVWIEDPNTPLR